MKGNHITSQILVQWLCPILRRMPQLDHLALSNNLIANTAIPPLVQSVSATVPDLYLGTNEITEFGMLILVSVPGIKNIGLFGNLISQAAVRRAADIMSNSTSLQNFLCTTAQSPSADELEQITKVLHGTGMSVHVTTECDWIFERLS